MIMKTQWRARVPRCQSRQLFVSLTVALLEDEQLDTIECESAEAALAVMLIGGQHVYIRLRGVMDGIDLAHEVRVRWPLLPVVLTSGHPLDEHLR